MRVSVDRAVCIGAGMCVNAAPAVFEMDDDGLAYGSQDDVPEVERAVVDDAAAMCPVGAIRIEP